MANKSVNTLQKNNISFFIPAWNCENMIPDALNSIIETNFESGDEIVITDDCSTDNTVAVIKKFQEKYDFIKLLHHKENKGCASSRNTAIKECQNEILFCLDADNILVPHSIKKLKKFMLKNKADAACFGELHYFKDSKTKKISHKWRYKKGIHTLADVLSGPISPISSGNYMFTKESWERAGGYIELTRILDTWTFGLKQIATGSILITMPNSFYFHRHGYESNYIHYSKKINTSSLAYEVLKPFFDLLDDEDIKYIKNNKKTWLIDLEKHPIKTKREKAGQNGRVIRKKHFFKFLRSKLKNILFLKKIKIIFFHSEKQKNLLRWKKDRGDETLRINYNLNKDSLVFDVGGYKGEWSEKIYNTYRCNIYIFEPVKDFFDIINKKNSNNKQIKTFNFGLSKKDKFLDININNEGSSVNIQGKNKSRAQFKSISGFIRDHNIKNIDLIKINIEGDEYDLLEDLLNNNLIKNIGDIQIQFHDFVHNANKKMKEIQKRLSKTHKLTYQYLFIWENWTKK